MLRQLGADGWRHQAEAEGGSGQVPFTHDSSEVLEMMRVQPFHSKVEL